MNELSNFVTHSQSLELHWNPISAYLSYLVQSYPKPKGVEPVSKLPYITPWFTQVRGGVQQGKLHLAHTRP